MRKGSANTSVAPVWVQGMHAVPVLLETCCLDGIRAPFWWMAVDLETVCPPFWVLTQYPPFNFLSGFTPLVFALKSNPHGSGKEQPPLYNPDMKN